MDHRPTNRDIMRIALLAPCAVGTARRYVRTADPLKRKIQQRIEAALRANGLERYLRREESTAA